jgi:hypothetical protein
LQIAAIKVAEDGKPDFRPETGLIPIFMLKLLKIILSTAVVFG